MAVLLNTCIRLGFSANAGASLVGRGFGTPKDLEELTSKEVVRSRQSLLSPGGGVPNPVTVPDAAGKDPLRCPLVCP